MATRGIVDRGTACQCRENVVGRSLPEYGLSGPSEAATGLFSIAGEGNVVSETLRAYTPEEVQRAIGPA